MKRLVLLLAMVLALATGCTTPGHVEDGAPTRIAVGMTRAEVVRRIGPPQSVTMEGRAEVMGYTHEKAWWRSGRFIVRLRGGRVVSYESKED